MTMPRIDTNNQPIVSPVSDPINQNLRPNSREQPAQLAPAYTHLRFNSVRDAQIFCDQNEISSFTQIDDAEDCLFRLNSAAESTANNARYSDADVKPLLDAAHEIIKAVSDFDLKVGRAFGDGAYMHTRLPPLLWHNLQSALAAFNR